MARSYVEKVAARFWQKVDRRGPDDCWIWQGTRMAPNKIGEQYGHIGISEKGRQISYRAHRLAYILVYGDLPDDMVVMHTCDNPLCVNPAHLKAGTQKENAEDMARKGRVAHGASHYDSRLTEDDVLAIFDDKTSTNIALARRYGIHDSNIVKIRRGERWRRLLIARGRISEHPAREEQASD